MNEIKEGATVRLNSGSPLMTIKELFDKDSDLSGLARTYYWDKNKGEFCTEMIQLNCLTLIEDKQ